MTFQRNRQNRDFDLDKLASAVLSGIFFPRRKLPKVIGAQVDHDRSFLKPLSKDDDQRASVIRELVPGYLL